MPNPLQQRSQAAPTVDENFERTQEELNSFFGQAPESGVVPEDPYATFGTVENEFLNDDIYQDLHSRGNDAQLALDAWKLAQAGDPFGEEFRTLISPPAEVLRRFGLDGPDAQEKWIERLERGARQAGVIGQNESFLEALQSRLRTENPEAGRDAMERVLEDRITNAAALAQGPADVALRLHQVYLDPNLSLDDRQERIRDIRTASSHLSEHDIRLEVRRLGDLVDTSAETLQGEFAPNHVPDADRVFRALNGKSPEQLALISARYQQLTGRNLQDEIGRVTVLDADGAEDARATQQARAQLQDIARGFDAERTASLLREEIERVRQDADAGGFLSNNWSLLTTGQLDDKGTDYNHLRRLMTGLSPDQMRAVREAYEGGNLNESLAEPSRDFSGYLTDARRQEIQQSTSRLNTVTADDAAPDAVQQQLEQPAQEIIRVLTADGVTPEEARDTVRDGFARLSPEQSRRLLDEIARIREEQLTTVETRPKLDPDTNEQMKDDAGEVLTEEVRTLDMTKPLTMEEMLRHRFGELGGPVAEVMDGFDAERASRRVLRTILEQTPEDQQTRDEILARELRGYTAEQVEQIEQAYTGYLERISNLDLDISEAVFAPEFEVEILNLTRGTIEPWATGPHGQDFRYRRGDEAERVVFQAGAIENPVDLALKLAHAANTGRAADPAERQQMTDQLMGIFRDLGDNQLAATYVATGVLSRGATPGRLQAVLPEQDFQNVDEAVQLGFNPWARVRRLEEALVEMGQPATREAGRQRVESILSEAAVGATPEQEARRVALLRRVFQQETGRELTASILSSSAQLTEPAAFRLFRPELHDANFAPANVDQVLLGELSGLTVDTRTQIVLLTRRDSLRAAGLDQVANVRGAVTLSDIVAEEGHAGPDLPALDDPSQAGEQAAWQAMKRLDAAALQRIKDTFDVLHAAQPDLKERVRRLP